MAWLISDDVSARFSFTINVVVNTRPAVYGVMWFLLSGGRACFYNAMVLQIFWA